MQVRLSSYIEHIQLNPLDDGLAYLNISSLRHSYEVTGTGRYAMADPLKPKLRGLKP